MEVSVVIACYNQAPLLARTLYTICRQWHISPKYEVIVVDDSSTDDTALVVQDAADRWKGHVPVRYLHHKKEGGYSNPAPARNMGYRAAEGRVILMQAADVFHGTYNTVAEMARVADNQYHVGQVLAYNEEGIVDHAYVGPIRGEGWETHPLCFLASMTKKSLMDIGGDDADFTKPGGDDRWFAMRVFEGFKMLGVWRLDVVGYHQYHHRPTNIGQCWDEMNALWHQKVELARKTGNWKAGKGAWD